MKKIEQFQITGMTIAGFKSYQEPTVFDFGRQTVITGGNGRGKTSIADAIAFAITGQPFFGERGIDKLHNEVNPDVSVSLRFVDGTGMAHELTRTRRNSRMTINFDGYEIRQMDLTDMYFVPRTYMDRVDIFEDFITLLGSLNRNNTPLMVNSFYIIDDEKQRGKMTEEFYAAVKKEIAAYQERCDYLIQSGSQSPAVMDRWVLKVKGLEEKKKHYEQELQRELDGLDDEFNTLKFLAQDLQVRANSIRFQKAA